MKPYLESYMVKSPYVGEESDTLREALETMHECNIRHLPIIRDNRLVGIVSERDLREALALPQAEALNLGDVMKSDVYVAKGQTPLYKVAREMQTRKVGSSVIVNDRDEVLGIFTTTDALGILADLLDNDSDEELRILAIEEYMDAWLPHVSSAAPGVERAGTC